MNYFILDFFVHFYIILFLKPRHLLESERSLIVSESREMYISDIFRPVDLSSDGSYRNPIGHPMYMKCYVYFRYI